MDKERISFLFQRYLDDTATPDELQELEEVISNPDRLEMLNEIVDGTYYTIPEQFIADKSGSQAKERSFEYIISQTQHQKTYRLWLRIAAAASILIMLGIGSYYFINKNQTQQIAFKQPSKNDIAPGKNTATLTLANGKKIILSDAVKGEIAKQSGVNITKTANGQVVYTVAENNDAEVNQFNTLSTAKGETYKVNLPDGTQVWLNAASSLTYPARFTGTNRKVTLTGEGYFEVAKDKTHPFNVATDKQEVTVLGTHFNINAYANEAATKTTLLEGSVKVSTENNNQIIKPGQQASLRNGNIKVQEIDADQTVAWKDNNFVFDGEDIQYIMRMVERWYNVEVVYDGYNSSEKYYGGVSRYENVSEVLKSLESTKKIHFKIEGRKIFVRK